MCEFALDDPTVSVRTSHTAPDDADPGKLIFRYIAEFDEVFRTCGSRWGCEHGGAKSIMLVMR